LGKIQRNPGKYLVRVTYGISAPNTIGTIRENVYYGNPELFINLKGHDAVIHSGFSAFHWKKVLRKTGLTQDYIELYSQDPSKLGLNNW
jgi:hypothetical protein